MPSYFRFLQSHGGTGCGSAHSPTPAARALVSFKEIDWFRKEGHPILLGVIRYRVNDHDGSPAASLAQLSSSVILVSSSPSDRACQEGTGQIRSLYGWENENVISCDLPPRLLSVSRRLGSDDEFLEIPCISWPERGIAAYLRTRLAHPRTSLCFPLSIAPQTSRIHSTAPTPTPLSKRMLKRSPAPKP